MITVLLEKFEYLANGRTFFDTISVKILSTLSSTTYAKVSRICWSILDDFSRSGPPTLQKLAFIYSTEGFCSGQNQKAKVLKIVINSYMSLVLNPKVRAHKSHICDRKRDHKVVRVSIFYEISLYCLIWLIMILSLPVCRVPTLIYTYKISARTSLLLMNDEIYNIYGLHQL